MTFSDIFAVVKELFLDWRLIVAFIVVLLYLNFVFYVSRYKKKALNKPKRIVKQQAGPAATASGDVQEASQDAGESASEDDSFV